jgi:hypothetical protein
MKNESRYETIQADCAIRAKLWKKKKLAVDNHSTNHAVSGAIPARVTGNLEVVPD